MAPDPKFLVRFSDDMRERLAEEATKNGRSLNQEILTRLRASFDRTPSSLEERVAKLEQAVFKKGK